MRLRDWQKSALLATLSLAIGFGIAEVLLRIFWDPGSYQPVIRADPVLGWALAPGTSLHSVDTDRHLDYHIQVNALGMRDPERARTKPPGVHRVLLLGDSMVFGTGVEVGARCGDVLQQQLGPDVEVLNAACGGWGTDQEFLYLCREGLALQPDVVVLALCLSNDVANNLLDHELYGTAPKPRFTLRGPELVLTPPAPRQVASPRHRLQFLKSSRLLHFVGRHARLLHQRRHPAPQPTVPYYDEDLETGQSHWAVFEKQYSPEMDAAFRVTEALITAAHDSCSAHGSELVLFAFPQKFEVEPEARAQELAHYGYDPNWFDLEAPYERLHQLAVRLGIPYVHPRESFVKASAADRLFFERDGHPNAAGHARAAMALEELVRASWGATAPHTAQR